MNIYLLSQTEVDGYDTYDSCVVIAENEEEAKLIHPDRGYKFRKELNSWIHNYWYDKYLSTESNFNIKHSISHTWCKTPESVAAKYLGKFKGNIEDYPSRVICASFNAG